MGRVIPVRPPVPLPALVVSGSGVINGGPTELSDWQTRSGGAGVVWAHNFDSVTEVNNFRYVPGTGTDPSDPASTVSWVEEDGFAGGGCLEINVPAGTHNGKDWRRPFSALNSPGNGLGVNDPAASGSITRQDYDPEDPNSYDWDLGWWGNADYTGQGQFDGTTTYYIQFRVKISASRADPGTPDIGKLAYIDAAPGLNQELVIRSRQDLRYDMYTSFGSQPNSFLTDPQDQEATGSWQPGGPYDATCLYPSFAGCYQFPTDEWVTVMVAVTPGHNWTSGTIAQAIADPNQADTRVEIWIAEFGDTTYTKIWDKSDYVWLFGGDVDGWNMLKFSTYMNGVDTDVEFYHRYTQVIFSTEPIPCPQVYEEEPATVPFWAETPFPGFWKVISTNVPDDVDPDPTGSASYNGTIGFDAMTDAWGGGWILPLLGEFGTYGLGPVGGHLDYYGNPVIAFDLSTGAWTLIRTPYASPTWPDADGWWPDNSPGSTHTYQQICGLEELNKIFIAARQTLNSPSQWLSAPAIYDFADDEWFKGSTYGGSGVPTMSEGCAAYDPSRTCVWLRGGDTGAAFAKYDYSNDTWTQYADQSSESYTMMCRDPNFDILLMIREVNFEALYGIDCNTPNTLRVELNEGTRPSISGTMGLVYSEIREGFVVWSDGEDVYLLKCSGSDWENDQWDWTNVTDSGNSVFPTRNSTGVYSKLQRIRYGDREFLITCQQTNGSTYAFEIPAP